MSALTVRLPGDKHNRLRAMARCRGTTLNSVIGEMTTMMLAEQGKHDAETQFRLRAARGANKRDRGVELPAKAAGS